MKLPDIRTTLENTLKMRVPAISPNENPRQRIDAMETYANEVATARAECLEALYWLAEAKKPLQAVWDQLTGWEAFVPARSSRTQEDVRQAKRRIKPDVYDGLLECAHLQKHLSDQVDRLNRDADWMSREYTFISG